MPLSTADGPARTVFFGSGEFAVPILEALVAAPDVDLVGVVSAPDRPSGRRAALSPTPVAARARELSLGLLQPARIRDEAAIREIAALHPDLGVLADYGQIVPAAILELPSHGILNVHPSLLPRHRGASPIPAAIVAGDPTTGVTIIRMDAGLDTGPIVAEEAWSLRGSETAPDLEAHAARAGARLVARSLPAWLDGSLTARPQDESAATQTRLLRKEDGRLDPGRPALELARQVRAFQPWPGSYVDTDAGRLTVWRATPSALAFEDEPGRLVLHDRLPALTTCDRRLVLDEVQPASGRRMSGEEFLRGRGRRLVTRSSD
ncbi:MAG: methionyl-tRNA formyltransferase [Chloroflexota bacterium]